MSESRACSQRSRRPGDETGRSGRSASQTDRLSGEDNAVCAEAACSIGAAGPPFQTFHVAAERIGVPDEQLAAGRLGPLGGILVGTLFLMARAAAQAKANFPAIR